MKSVGEYTFQTVRGAVSPEIASEVVGIWTNSAGLDFDEAKRRIQELVIIVRNDSQRIVGVSTASKTFLKQIQNYVYAYRCFILPEFRAPALDTQMIVKSKGFLEKVSLEDHYNKCVGIMVVVQNEVLKLHWRQAIWPGANMMYIGNAPNGDHIRISYFKGARI